MLLLKLLSSDPDILNNLAFISKVNEKVVADRVTERMSLNKLMDQYYSTYSMGYSTEKALANVHHSSSSSLRVFLSP